MSTLLRRLCARLDTFYERHPVLAILAAIVVCVACEIAIAAVGAVTAGITHVGGFA